MKYLFKTLWAIGWLLRADIATGWYWRAWGALETLEWSLFMLEHRRLDEWADMEVKADVKWAIGCGRAATAIYTDKHTAMVQP